MTFRFSRAWSSGWFAAKNVKTAHYFLDDEGASLCNRGYRVDCRIPGSSTHRVCPECLSHHLSPKPKEKRHKDVWALQIAEGFITSR